LLLLFCGWPVSDCEFQHDGSVSRGGFGNAGPWVTGNALNAPLWGHFQLVFVCCRKSFPFFPIFPADVVFAPNGGLLGARDGVRNWLLVGCQFGQGLRYGTDLP